MGRLFYEDKEFNGGFYEEKPIRKVWYEDELLWPSASLKISPSELIFDGDGASLNVGVTVTGTSNTAYSVQGLPAWLGLSNQTATGFTLTAVANPTENLRTVVLTVRLNAYPDIQASLSVIQSGAWLSQFIFDVVTTQPYENVQRIVNLGAIASGEASFDYGDGTALELKTVPQSEDKHLTDDKGNDIVIKTGTDFSHVFQSPGTHTITIKIRQGVDAFRFSSVPDGSVGDWGAEFAPNDYIRGIKKIKSETLASGYKMLAGCRKAFFDSAWEGLETPNMTDFGFIMENFGSYGSGADGAFTANDRLRLPANMYQHISPVSKSKVTSCARAYIGSGFERIEPSMLDFSADDTLVTGFELFRGMRNLGANWVEKYGNGAYSQADAIASGIPEFVDTSVFLKQRNLKTFEGMFNAVNDYYGNYSNGYAHLWLLKQDLFKGNNATDVNINWMFHKATRALLENNFFGAVSNGGVPFNQRIKTMNGCFYGFGGGTPKLNWDKLYVGFRGARIDQHPDGLFPDASYPALVTMQEAFAYYKSSGNHNRNISEGFNGLFNLTNASGAEVFNHPFNLDGGGVYLWDFDGTSQSFVYGSIQMNNVNIAQFLSRFPNCTNTSGTDDDGITVIDGAANNFGDWDAEDGTGAPRAEDYHSFAAGNPLRAAVLGRKIH